MSSPPSADAPPSYLYQDHAHTSAYIQTAFGPSNCSTPMYADHKPPVLQPRLGLRARLFLAPISIPVISILFVGSRLWMSSTDAHDSVSSAKSKILSECEAVEGTASLAASLPHFLAATAKVQLAQSVTSTVYGAARVFELSITAIENILVYMVNSYKSLFMCFMELLVRGSLAVLIEAVQLISQAITAAAQGIRAAIQESVEGVNAILSTAVSAINDVVAVFGQHVNPPKIVVPSLTALENITLPHEIQDGLLKLNATLPTLQQLKQTMDTLIKTPFEQLKREVNETLSRFQFNDTLLPTPQMQNVTFCERIDTSALDELGDELKSTARWGLVVLGLVALVAVLIGVSWEWWNCQREVRAVERTRGVWLAQHPQVRSEEKDSDDTRRGIYNTENLMSLLAISRHPLISSFSLSFCQRVGITTQVAQDRLAWLFCFITNPASLACVFTGILGLISVLLQTILIHRLADHYTSSINTSLAHLSSDVINLVNDHTRNASLAFSTSANDIILQMESELNDHVFLWVDTTTSTMNATLNQFVDGITDTLTTTFGGTPFNAPLQTFVQCILGQKVRGIEKALTWIQDNAHVNFTMVPQDVLMLKGQQQEAVLRPVREAMLGDGGEGDGVVGSVVGRYSKHLHQEKGMFAALVGVYGVIVVVGLMAVLWATIVDRGGSGGGGRDCEVVEEQLRSDLQAGPGGAASSWSRVPKPSTSTSRFGKLFSRPSIDPVAPSSPSEEMSFSAHRNSTAHSNRSARTHVTKDSISYPFQIHHSLNVASARPRQPTPLRQATCHDRNTVLSLHQDVAPTRTTQQEPRNSWLSFLATHSHDDPAATEGEAAQDGFQRLFGCSPIASPTTTRFEHHASTSDGSNAVGVGGSDTARYTETLDLRRVQDWIGSKSPIPLTTGKADGPESEVKLTRSGAYRNEEAVDTAEGSYPFNTTAASQIRPPNHQQQQHQGAIHLPQSISFYAW